jgi:hypothetical protein
MTGGRATKFNRRADGPFRGRPTDGSVPSLGSEPPLILGCPWPERAVEEPVESPNRSCGSSSKESTIVSTIVTILSIFAYSVIGLIVLLIVVVIGLLRFIVSAL